MNKSGANKKPSPPIEIIPDRLYWLSAEEPPRHEPKVFFFCVDKDLVYESFFEDFGPLDIAKSCKFVTALEKILKDPQYKDYHIYHYTSLDTGKRANAACLMGIYQMLSLGRTAYDSWSYFKNVTPPLADFRDASSGPSTYSCSILDVLRGLEYAMMTGLFDRKQFNVKEYEHYEKIENGDLNWVIPGKLIAFVGPAESKEEALEIGSLTPEEYCAIFKKLGVKHVVSLSKRKYNENAFIKGGFNFTDLYFTDGSVPSFEVVAKFLEVCENEPGAIAVHCKAGLGRTGTLIGCYAMKHYKFCAAEFIGWIRLCRPGSVLGPQQQFLCEIEEYMHSLAEESPIYKNIYPNLETYLEQNKEIQKERKTLTKQKAEEASQFEKKIAIYGENNQGQKLLEAKNRFGPFQLKSIWKLAGGSTSTDSTLSPGSEDKSASSTKSDLIGQMASPTLS